MFTYEYDSPHRYQERLRAMLKTKKIHVHGVNFMADRQKVLVMRLTKLTEKEEKAIAKIVEDFNWEMEQAP